MKYISLEATLDIHEYQIVEFGGLPGIRDIGLLASALEMPKTACFGKEMYASIYEKATAYLYFLTKNHPFYDGNKRTALATSLVFLDMNGIEPNYSPEELEALVVAVAANHCKFDQVTDFFRKTPN